MAVKEILRRCRMTLILAAATMPLPWVLLAFLAPELLGLGWSWCLVYWLLVCLCFLVPGKRRMFTGCLGAAAMLAGGVLLAPEGAMVGTVLVSGGYAVLLLWSLGLAREGELPNGVFPVGVLIHLFGQIMLSYLTIRQNLLDAGAPAWFFASFLIFMVLTMISLNRKSLSQASGKRRSVPNSMSKKNLLITLGAFFLTFGVSLIPRIFEWIKKIMKALLDWLLGLILKLLSRPSGAQTGAPAGEGNLPMAPMEGEPPSELALLLEKIFRAAASAVVVVLAVYLAYILGKKALKYLRILLAGLSRFAAGVGEDYVDEITDTREAGGRQFSLPKFLRKVPKQKETADMDPRQRVRLRYRNLCWSHPEWAPGATAREKVSPAQAALYEKARYSDHPISDQEAKSFLKT